MKQLYLFIIIGTIISFSSCKDEDLKAPVPAYLTINDIIATEKDPSNDTASDAIVDAWVFQNDQLLGAFELPATIPIQKTGQMTLKVRAGILNNGLTNDRAQYPFYNFFVLDTFLNPQEELNLTPKVKYFSNSTSDEPWSGEDFESGINFEHNESSDTTLSRETDPNIVFEGNASGVAYLDESMDFFEAYTPTFSDIPRGTAPVYLEFNYFSTHDLSVGIYTDNGTKRYPIVNFRARSNWNKVYVELTPVFSTLFSASNYNITISFTKPLGEKGRLYLDNVKMVHFQ